MSSLDLTGDHNCSSCLEVFSDLIKLRCGHNFYRECFVNVLGSQERTGGGSPGRGDICPGCTVLSSNSDNQPEPPEDRAAEIFCTYCIHSQVPAIQSCLHCEASLCAGHLKVHTKSQEHILTKPTESFKDSKCSIHNKILDFYCCQDNLCICISCHLEEHRGHQVRDFNEAFEKLKEKMDFALDILTSEAEEIEKRTRRLQDRQTNLQEKAASAAERVCALFRNLRKQQEDLENKILKDISWQEKQISLSVSNRILHLEQNREELSRKIGNIKDLYERPNPLMFSQWLNSENHDLHKLRRESVKYRKTDVRMAYALKEFDEGPVIQALHTGLLHMVATIKKGIFVQEASDLLLDVNTAANNVAVTEDLKELSCPGSDQWRIEKGERFDFSQVLSSGKFGSGRHYWDVEVGDSGNFRLGVAYPTIERKGGQARIGNNDKSWCLGKEDDTLFAIHDSNKNCLERDFSWQKIRIYLDYEAGQLSFYELGDSIRHLHTFTATFTEPLHAAFCIFLTSWVRILS
ncbi:E3 ubiquitin/ISG15 ligase TRIM25-like [Rana temporaria]|uniref:E3 ubiquitin/ISG15 ligase TRIM25-like n=1 Tax=Rana temporaria TaxID=8407 RepID=UPI001AACAE67|nr:E3 ubiquitin/ISG15 ligase TRIM25-like [Rana temporaria]